MQAKVYIQLDLFEEGESTVSRISRRKLVRKDREKVSNPKVLKVTRKVDERQKCFCFEEIRRRERGVNSVKEKRIAKIITPEAKHFKVKHTSKEKENYVEPNKGLSPEKNLWLSVIELAMCDSLFNDRFKQKDKWKQNMMSESKSSAICWLNLLNNDFITVCRLAELEP